MRRAALFLAAFALAIPAGAAPVHRAPPAPAARDWSRTVVATPEGGFRMGNPAAPVKLVEYGSLTCPHCAAFAREGTPPLVAKYVRTGKVSYEFRNYILNSIDVSASLVARCAGPVGFFRIAETLYATQKQWVDRILAERDRLNALPEPQRLPRVVEIGGFYQVAARYGLTAARARQCLADPRGLERLGQMYQAAQALGVTGTPTFFLNGNMLDVNEWPSVEPLIRQATGG
ncbi:MAG: hypothetical protein QOG84_1034 [Sphingomonadales bacterium]|nr:hypothetical protein [Sphingomonadales bacterium]